MQDPQIRAADAKALLESPLLKGAFEEVRNKLVIAAENVGMNDKETQSNIVLSLQLLKQIKAQVESYVNDGKIAEFKLKQKKGLFG